MRSFEIIKEKANWCLNCKTRPCSQACPMHTNIPDFIQKVKEEKYEEAYQILIENNLFSHICSLVCPQEEQCEGSCTRGIKSNPVDIGCLESFVNEWAELNKIEPNPKIEKSTKNIKVAIVGAGPAGLSCSYELAKKGISCTVFEKENVLGGILNYGIPDFRLNKKFIDGIIQTLEKMGVEFKLGQELGKNISIKNLKENFDFVFIGIGSEISNTYSLSDQDTGSIYSSNVFLRAYNSNNYIKDLGDVVVIGGGNVAMDTARAAARMGAKSVSILYRRDITNMPAKKLELFDALVDGVKWVDFTRVVKANIEDGKIISVHCNKTQIMDGKVIDVSGEEFDHPANTVIFAIGSKPNKELLQKEGFELTDWGTIKLDENNQTSIENVYCGGDVCGSSVVCKALAGGKKAAEAIIKRKIL